MTGTGPPAATLWLRTDTWWVRADQVAAVGIEEVFHTGGRYSVRIRLVGAATGADCHELCRFAAEEDARASASAVTERITSWEHGYGTLYLTSSGEVRTTRPVPDR